LDTKKYIKQLNRQPTAFHFGGGGQEGEISNIYSAAMGSQTNQTNSGPRLSFIQVDKNG
jgi:hypothetical protein